MRRKVTVLAVVLAMAMAFAACGGKDAEDVSGKIIPAVSDEKENDDTDVTPTEAVEDQDADEDKEVTEAPEVTEEPEATEEAGKTTSLGRVQGGVYVNEYMGISCNLDSNWEFYTAEELQELPENVAEMFAGTAMEDEMSELNYITDMSAENMTDLTSMNIIYQKMSIQERLAFKTMTNSDVVDGMLGQKDFLIATYAQTGINVTEFAKKTVNFCGEDCDALYMVSDVNGVAYYALQLFDYSLGDYSVTMTVSSFVEDKTDELLTLFSKYE